ncbi:hypothetical protein F5876DRAFT_35639 [Lentinula aff. lateritia]|uniref:Uncharacterized protein n=1 Tax=Lentinula aff. lateritia TaxID=2804960 RepID=A0ACC1U8V3_9AGAR|nr:hypothetical protein F5876DRAFT_35639 [Lentinula aff. lateritia]
MPRQRKSRETSKKLKQTTLTGSIQSPSRGRSKPSPAQPVAKRRRVDYLLDEQNEPSDDSDIGAFKLEPKGPDEDDDELTPSPAKWKRMSFVVGSDAEESEEDVPIARRGTRSVKRKEIAKVKKSNAPVENKIGKDSVSPPRHRKLVKGKRPAAKSDSEESDEVEPERIIESRFRSRDKKTEYQKNLERLKRKKQGKPMDSDDGENEEEKEEEEEEAPFKGAMPDSDKNSLFDSSESFIVEDDGAGSAALPVEFSMESHQDLSHNFKKIFQFFVHIAVHPPIERHEFMEIQMKNEVYFSVPLSAARRKIIGLRDSLVASSVWKPEFKGPLERYPELDLVQLEFSMPGCDACNLGARMSTLNGRLLGEPYDRLGFEDLDLSDESLSEGECRTDFHLGRFCARRTRVYHDLSHWEYMLFKTINEEVDDLHVAKQEKGASHFVRVAWPEGLQPPKDLQDADGICDWLDQRKVVEMEWEKLKGYMERARGLELAAKKGDDAD